jgi:death-on-curing protein
VKFPTLEEIIGIDRRHIAESGGGYCGSDNVINLGSLEWVLDTIQYPLFGVDQYPSLEEKAAILAWTIIKSHVFFDGNKRTGMTALIYFVRLNRYRLNITPDEIVEIAVKIAGESQQDYSLQELVQWIRSKLVPEDFGQQLR